MKTEKARRMAGLLFSARLDKMNVRLLTAADAPGLEAFVAKHPRGSIEQVWDFGLLQTSIPGRNSFFVLGAFEREMLVASMLVIRQNTGFGKSWLWCPRGPLLPKERAAEAWAALKKMVEQLAHKAGDVFLRVEPGALVSAPLTLGGKSVTAQYLPKDTLLLDLQLSKEELLKQMTQKGRYNIKIAEREEVYVRKGLSSDLPDFFTLLEETAKRDGFVIHNRDFYQKFLDVLDGKALFYVAYVDHEVVGGFLGTQFGNRVTYYFGASSNKHRQKMAPYALQWFAIREAQNKGFKEYDFLGIAPEGDAKHALAGVTQFKTRFGGGRISYQAAEVFVLRRVWWWLYRLAKMTR